MSTQPMHPRHTFRVYPRPDNAFASHSSLNFDMMRSKIMLDRPHKKLNEGLWVWVAHALTGMFVGTITFLLTLCEDKSVSFRKNTL